jgi:lysozyme family protein
MARVELGEGLREAYRRLFDACVIRRERMAQVDAIVKRLVARQSRYARVANAVGAPWFVAGVIHSLEASLNFSRHLHNGDPLTARTVHVPAGRPAQGSPPFTWEESAVDALRLRGMHRWSDWSVPGTLYQLEGYNGWGYRLHHPHVQSPYLWSFSNHYKRGKYVADGRWSETAVSRQAGAAVLLRRMVDRGSIEWEDDTPNIGEIQDVVEESYRLLARGEIKGQWSEAHYRTSIAGVREYAQRVEDEMYRLLARGEINGQRSEGHYRQSTASLREQLLAQQRQLTALQQELTALKDKLRPTSAPPGNGGGEALSLQSVMSQHSPAPTQQ